MGTSGGNDSAYYRQQEQDRQDRIRRGTASIGNTFDRTFTPAFFDRQRQNFDNYALPQLHDQKTAADKSLLYSLSRSGNLESSTRAGQEGDLQREYGQRSQQIADQGLSFENQTKGNVADARDNLVATLNATGDATAASQSAINRAQTLSQPATYDPIGSLFSDVTGNIANTAAAQRAAYYAGQYGAGGGSGGGGGANWFGPQAGAVTVR